VSVTFDIVQPDHRPVVRIQCAQSGFEVHRQAHLLLLARGRRVPVLELQRVLARPRRSVEMA
jgi:hypothetical protein